MSGWLLGLLVGAFVGAVARCVVTLSYSYYLWNWGGPWFRGSDPNASFWSAFSTLTAIISAALGVIVGGVAGATCKPLWGALMGALLSAGLCLGLAVLPGEVALAMKASQHGESWAWEQGERLQVLLGVVPMTVAGAIAGGVGAAVGSRRRKEMEQRPVK